MRRFLDELEHESAASGEAGTLVALAYVASAGVELGESEVRAACRRALLVLAAGGDPRRALDPDDRAVRAIARDLETPERDAQLRSGLRRLAADAGGLAHVEAAAGRLLAEPDLAWRSLASALLAHELAEEE